MLIIRNDQMKALESAAFDEFVDRLLRDLDAEHPDLVEGLTPEQVKGRIILALERARKYGLESQYALAAFALLAFRLGPRFDEYPPIQLLLDQASEPDHERIDAIFARLTPQQWLDAQRRSCADDWGPSGQESHHE